VNTTTRLIAQGDAAGGSPPAKVRYDDTSTWIDYKRPASVTLDPSGVFLELDGSPAWIDRTARRLGFSESQYITRSYGGPHLESCAARGRCPRHMEFQ